MENNYMKYAMSLCNTLLVTSFPQSDAFERKKNVPTLRKKRINSRFSIALSRFVQFKNQLYPLEQD